MKTLFYLASRCLIIFLAFISSASAQVQISPKYSVDGTVNTLASYGDTLIVGGNFSNIGVHTGGGALFNTSSDQPNLAFPKVIGNITSSTPDGAGGFYVYGDFRKESDNIQTLTYRRIEHIKADFTFDTAFSLNVVALFGINKLLFHNGLLYVAGNYLQTINGQTCTNDLVIIDVATKQFASWTPAITPLLQGINNVYIAQNTLYVMGNFTTVGGQTRNKIAAVELNTGVVKPWNFAVLFTDFPVFEDIKSYKNKVIISGSFASGSNRVCALVDTVTGITVEYIFSTANLHSAGTGGALAVSGDTLFAFTMNTDTRATAINLADSNKTIWRKYFNSIAGAFKMEAVDGGLYIAGRNFYDTYFTNFPNDAGNKERSIRGLFKLNTATGAYTNWNADPIYDRTVPTISLSGSNIFAGGYFTHVNSQVKTGIVMLKASTQEILPFNINLTGHSIRSFKIIDTTLYAGGDYFTINGVINFRSILAFSMQSGVQLPFNTPYLGAVESLEGNSKFIFAGGNLTEPPGGQGRQNLFAINRLTGNLAPWYPNPNAGVNALHLLDGKLFVGGNFTSIAGIARNYAAAFDTATQTLQPWNPNPDWLVYSLNSSYGTIWMGGIFINTGGSFCPNIAGVHSVSGAVLHKPFPSYIGSVNAINIIGCHVILGGNFRLNDTTACNALYAYDQYNKVLVPSSSWCINIDDLGGTVKALTTIDNALYLGGAFTKVNGKAAATNSERVRVPIAYFTGCNEFVTVQSGNYNSPSTWKNGLVPGGDGRIRIKHAISVNGIINTFTLKVEPGGTLIIANGAHLKVIN